MSKVAKWIFPAAGGKDGIIGTAKSVVGFLTGNAGMVMDGVRQVAGAGRKGDAQARQASVLNLQLGEVPRQAVIGIACTAGSLVDVFSFGGKYGTDKVTRCVLLADHAIDGVEGFYINEVYYPWVGEGQQAAFSNKLSFHFRQATLEGHEPPAHVMANGGWPATDRLVGVTVMWIDWYVDDKVWPQGHPAIRFVLRGLRVYDPRFDPQHGYTGPNPQTWADRSSHRFSRNAKVLRYAYTRGIFVEGRQGQPEHLLIGRGLSEEEAPGDLVIPDANLCDEIVDGVARYTANGVISASQPFIEVDGMFAAAMAGVIVQREGTVDVEAGQAKAISATFTDADLVIGEKVGFSRFLGDNDGGRLNTFIGRYIEPLLGWKDHSAPVRRSQADIQTDGGPRESTVSLSLVTEVKQADRIVEINRLLSRLERRGNVVLPPRFAGLEEGDWVAWQSARRHKGATVRYRIEAYREPETWRKYLTLREIASSVFGVPDPIEDFTVAPPPPAPIDALQLLGVNAEAITLAGETSALPAVRFTWDVDVEDTAITAIRAEVRKVGETEIAPTRIDDVAKGQAVVTAGVWPDTQLECRLVPIGDPSRPVLLSNWITVSTAPVSAGISDDVINQIKQDLEAILDGSAEAEKVAEVLLETILNERDSLEAEAAERLENDTGVLNEAKSFSDGKLAMAMNTVYTRAQTDAGIATTLQSARSYTDAYKSEANLTFSTRTERENGDASAVITAKSYTDAYKSEASLSFATKAQLNSSLASTLIESQSYSDGKLSSALTTIYTKAQTDAGRASTLIEAKSYTDALQSYSTLNFSTKAELNGVSGQAALALSTAVTADGKVKAKFGLATQVGNLIGGIESENDGVIASVRILSSIFSLISTGSSDRADFSDGIWYFYDAAGTTRTMVGRPFGGSHKLTIWTGPMSVPIGGEGKDNAYVYMSMNTVGGPRFGGSDVAGGAAPLAATTSSDIASGSKPGGGTVSSNTITINVTGQGAASAVVRWVKTEQSGGTVDVYPNGRNATFQGNVAPGGLTRAIYLAVVTVPGGASVTVVQDVQLTDSN